MSFKKNSKIMLIIIKSFFATLILTCLISCSTDRLIVPNDSAHAKIEITAPKFGSFSDDVGLGLAGPVVCDTFFVEKHAFRKAVHIITATKGKTKSANIPAGKDTVFVVSQNIGDRYFYGYWQMFVKHNSLYSVYINNTYSEKRFGGFAPNFDYEVYEDGKKLPIIKINAPQNYECD